MKKKEEGVQLSEVDDRMEKRVEREGRRDGDGSCGAFVRFKRGDHAKRILLWIRTVDRGPKVVKRGPILFYIPNKGFVRHGGS
jgi:hypothetical protein